MTYVLYADVMFIWSSVINAVVLILAAAILNLRIKITRIIVWAALTGAVTTVEYILLLGANKFLHYILYAAIYIIMTTAFFTFKSFSGSIRLLLAIFVSTILIYGIWGAGINALNGKAVFPVLLICLFFLTFFCRNIKKYSDYERSICQVSILVNKKCIRCRGYMDSGNTLYDYATGYPVIILGFKLAKRLLGENLYTQLNEYKKTGSFDYVRGDSHITFYPVCYSTVSEQQAVMPGFKINSLCLIDKNTIYTKVIAAISRYSFGGNDYEILLHKDLNK